MNIEKQLAELQYLKPPTGGARETCDFHTIQPQKHSSAQTHSEDREKERERYSAIEHSGLIVCSVCRICSRFSLIFVQEKQIRSQFNKIKNK